MMKNDIAEGHMLLASFLVFGLTACNESDIADTADATGESAIEQNDVNADLPATDPGVNGDEALVALGREIFFDTNLSNPPGQSCASCHAEASGFADPDAHFPTSEGAVAAVFGNRNTPTVSYTAFVPPLRLNNRNNRYTGGLFLDGREDSLEAQALAPFLNPLEMNNTDAGAVIDSIRDSNYADQFSAVFGEDSLDQTDTAFLQVGEAIAAFERSDVFAPFTSKFDAVQNGTETFTAEEQRGLNLFNGRAQCSICHLSSPDEDGRTLFTNFEYENIGTPANPNNPFYQTDPSFVDAGLGSTVNEAGQNGKFRNPSLRNVAITAPYMHNGVFNTLEEVVQFYNVRDVDPNQALPEVPDNLTNVRIGNLGMSARQVEDLVAFMETLTDR